jgi:hypothetical protein
MLTESQERHAPSQGGPARVAGKVNLKILSNPTHKDNRLS